MCVIPRFRKFSLICLSVFCLWLPNSVYAESHGWKKVLVKVAEHVSLGGGTELAVAHIGAGRSSNWQAGLVAVGIVAIVKEGSDYIARRDPGQVAFQHGVMIFIGGGSAAILDHSKGPEIHSCRANTGICWDPVTGPR